MSELSELLDFLRKQPPAHTMPLAERRALYDRAETAFPLPDGVAAEPWREGGLEGDLIRVEGARPDRAILYLHGGGYAIGSHRSHRHLAAALGVAARADVLVPHYRLAPENPFPAALDDALAAHDWLRRERPDARICVMGDSAGGGLAAAVLISLRDRGGPQPAAGVCLSPWVDLDCASNAELKAAAAGDPMVDFTDISEYAGAYLGDTPAENPLASPIHADLGGLPPLLIQASRDEALRSDSERLAAKAEAAGVEVTLELSDELPHVWHWFWPRLEIARESIASIGSWLEPRWDAA